VGVDIRLCQKNHFGFRVSTPFSSFREKRKKFKIFETSQTSQTSQTSFQNDFNSDPSIPPKTRKKQQQSLDGRTSK